MKYRHLFEEYDEHDGMAHEIMTGHGMVHRKLSFGGNSYGSEHGNMTDAAVARDKIVSNLKDAGWRHMSNGPISYLAHPKTTHKYLRLSVHSDGQLIGGMEDER